jgi:hypothetical protein
MTRPSPFFLMAFLMAISIADAFAPTSLVGRTTSVSNVLVCQYANNDNIHEKKSSRGDVKYIFISVEEAEEALRQERMFFDKERQQMRGLLDDQRRQLEELASRQVQRQAHSSKRKGSSSISESSNPAGDILESGNCSITPSTPLFTSKMEPHHQAINGVNAEGGVMHQEQYQEKLMNIENQLSHIMDENERLVKRLQDQHRNFKVEKLELQERILEEQERLTHLREELNMERAYFETSRKLLENLLETEQKKVMSLQEELFSRDLMGRQFARGTNGGGGGPDVACIYEDFATFSNGKQRRSPRRAGKPRSRPCRPEGLEMNMNDIRSPLYP